MPDISPVSEGDYAELASFLASSKEFAAPLDFWRGRLRLWWDDNPAFPAPDLARGWALREQGRIQGFIGSIPSMILAAGKPDFAVNSTTWIVAPSLRGSMAAMRLLMKQLGEVKDRLLVNATPTGPVVDIIERLGFRPLPGGGGRDSFLFINEAACARAAAPVLRLIPGLAAAAGMTLHLAQAGRLKLASPLRAERLSEAGHDFDALWERTKGAYETTNVRAAGVLRWHCFLDQSFPKILLGAFEGSRLCAYMILRPKTRLGLPVLECCDLWGETELARPALAALVGLSGEVAAKAGAKAVLLPHFSPALGAFYKQLGLWEGAAPVRKAYYKAPPELAAAVENGRGYFTGLQGDAGSAP